MNTKFSHLIFLASIVFSPLSLAGEFSVNSEQILQGQKLTSAQVFNGFGCDGANISPNLYWHDAPKNTKSFAVTLYDPDAPTGSGFWHWTVLNIPSSVTNLQLDTGNVNGELLPIGARHVTNDYGTTGFGGACPPVGDNPHRYVLTLHALDTENIELPANVSSAVAGFMINAHEIDRTSITSHYMR